jgi:cation:H+ antiporter
MQIALETWILVRDHPLVLLTVFILASGVMIWRLEVMESKGFEGTVLGTLIMPYCSGFPNLIFAYVMGREHHQGRLVIENCIVNNVTNLTLILGLAIVLSTHAVQSTKSSKKGAKNQQTRQRMNRLDVVFTLVALFLFTGALWALAKDSRLDFYDGLVLVGLFIFWQILHVFEILKNKIRQPQGASGSVIFDLVCIALSAYGVYFAVDHLVAWIEQGSHFGLNMNMLGWLSGFLMVLPNALIALYYARLGRQDVVFSSQIGDSHICIPMCVGLFALFNPIQIPVFFQTGVMLILGAGVLHLLCMALIGRVPKILGVGLIGSYGYFLYAGMIF